MARPKAGSPRKVKRARKPKDPDAPKKPTTAFFFYVKHRREGKHDQGMKVSEFTKECGNLWRKLGEDGQSKFQKQAEADRDRYKKAMAAYNPSSVTDPNEPPKPKKPATAFLLFANRKRPELLADGFSPKEVLQEAGKLWKECDDDEKEELEGLAAEEKKKYEKAMAKYNEELKSMRKNGSAKKPAAKKADSDDDDDDDDEEEDDMDSDDE